MISYQDVRETIVGIPDSKELSCGVALDALFKFKLHGESSKFVASLLVDRSISIAKLTGILMALEEYRITQPVHDSVYVAVTRIVEERIGHFEPAEENLVMSALRFLKSNYHKNALAEATRIVLLGVDDKYQTALEKYIVSILKIGRAMEPEFHLKVKLQIGELESSGLLGEDFVKKIRKKYLTYYPARYRFYVRLVVTGVVVFIAALLSPVVMQYWSDYIEPLIWLIGVVFLILSVLFVWKMQTVSDRYLAVEANVASALFRFFRD